MLTRTVLAVTAIAVLLLLLAACESEPTPSPYTGYLTEEIPPCTAIAGSSVDPCELRGPIETFGAAGGISPAFDTEEPRSIRQFIDGWSLSFIPHIVLRGTYMPGTVRCTSGDANRVPSYAKPGYFQHSILINCYADVRVNEYVLGKGPAQLIVLVTFHHYWEGYYAEVAAQENLTEQEVVEQLRAARVIVLEQGFHLTGEGVYGREVILFAGPGHSHAHEVWEVVETWDVQRREDGTVIAVHPHRDDWRGARPDKYREYRSRLEMELPAFTQAVTAANQTRVNEYGGRIGADPSLPLLISDVHDLDDFMANTGAYDHPDGTPVPPPPIPGEDDPVPELGVDDSTPGPSPPVPGGEEEPTPSPTPPVPGGEDDATPGPTPPAPGGEDDVTPAPSPPIPGG